MSKSTLRRRHATLAASASMLALFVLAGCGGGTDAGVVPAEGNLHQPAHVMPEHLRASPTPRRTAA